MSDQIPPPSGQFPPRRDSFAPHVARLTPSRGSKVVRNVLIVVIVFGVLACAACLARAAIGSDDASSRARMLVLRSAATW